MKQRLIAELERRAGELERKAATYRYHAETLRQRGSGPLPYYERVMLAEELEVVPRG